MQVSLTQARKTMDSLLDAVGRGEEVVITRYGKPIARLVPVPARSSPPPSPPRSLPPSLPPSQEPGA